MKLQGRTLSADMHGEDVKLLQSELRQLSFPIADAELQGQSFGELTRGAVQAFQKQHGLQPSGIVDERTAELINLAVGALRPQPQPQPTPPPPPEPQPAGQPNSFLVKGQVRRADDRLVDCIVRAFDRDMRSRELLGEAATDLEGRYEIAYSLKQFARVEKDTADLTFEVATREGVPLKILKVIPVGFAPRFSAVPDVLFNSPPVATVDLVVDAAGLPEPSEFERLMAELTPMMEGADPAALTSDDTAFLVGETDIDRGIISLFAQSARLGKDTDVPPAAFYGLGREGVPIDPATLASQAPDLLRRTLRQALTDNIIPTSLGESLDAITDQIHQRLVARALREPPAPGAASLGALLAGVVPDAALQAQFLSLYASRTGTVPEFWQQLRKDPTFGQRGMADKIQRTLQLSLLTSNHLPLVQQLRGMLEQGKLKSLRDLAQLDADAWSRLIEGTGRDGLAAIPADVTGKDDAERVRAFGTELADTVERAFPTAVVAREVLRAKPQSPAGMFLSRAADFEFAKVHVDSYLAAHAADLPANLEERSTLALDLKRMQRMFTVAPRAREMLVLLDAGVPSARAIARIGQSTFVAQFGDRIGADRARELHGRAVRVAFAAAAAYARYAPAMNSLDLAVTRSKS